MKDEFVLLQHCCAPIYESLFLHPFSLVTFVSFKEKVGEHLQLPPESFRQKLSLSYLVRRTFSSGKHREANWRRDHSKMGACCAALSSYTRFALRIWISASTHF
jgi:hypothetical protein